MRILLAIIFITTSLLLLRWMPKPKWLLSAVYIAAIVYFAFLIREPTPIYHYNLKLFGAARKGIEFGGGVLESILNGNIKVVNWASLEGIILNILLFIPFGYLMPLIWSKADRWWKVTLLGFCVSLFIELLQLFTRLGYADVDDLINNTVGALIGYVLYKLILNNSKTHCRREEQHGSPALFF